jgi:transcriptional regulator with XRE-family HTH domain
MAKKREKLSDQVRRAIEASGLSRYRICQEAGILQSVMSRFMNRRGMLSMERLDALADLLALNITVGNATTAKKGPTRGQHQQ